MIEIKAPADYSSHKNIPSIFLAGSIEMGAAEAWQKKVVESLHLLEAIILNPRRAQWDSSWEQSIDNPQFRTQVEWELEALEHADITLMYIAPGTKSPITLLELGLQAARHPRKLIVCCPKGFWRKGNVDIVCARYGVRQVGDLEELIAAGVSLVKAM